MSRLPTFPATPPAIRFVLATAVINAIGFGIVIPVTPALIMELGHASLSQATAIGGWLSFAFAIAQFVFSPIIGNLSDRIGRRPILLASQFGMALDFVVLAIAPNLFWVFVIRTLAGVFGASNASAQAVIADIIPADQRARIFGMMGAAFGFGFIIGPAIGGVLGEFGVRVPFYVAAAMCIANMLYGVVVFRESQPVEHRRAFDWKRANPVGALMQARLLPGIGAIATAYLLWQLATMVYPMTWPYFTSGRYGWSESLVGLSLAAVGMTMVAVQVLVLPRAVVRLGERNCALMGIIGASLGMLGYAAATQGWMAFALLPLMAFQSLVQPNLNAMMSRLADETSHGEVQGFAASLMAVGSLVAPLLFNPLHAWFTSPAAPVQFYGAAYLAAGLIGLACIPFVLAIREQRTVG